MEQQPRVALKSFEELQADERQKELLDEIQALRAEIKKLSEQLQKKSEPCPKT